MRIVVGFHCCVTLASPFPSLASVSLPVQGRSWGHGLGRHWLLGAYNGTPAPTQMNRILLGAGSGEAGYPPSSLVILMAMVMMMMMLLDKAILKLIFFFFWDVT